MCVFEQRIITTNKNSIMIDRLLLLLTIIIFYFNSYPNSVLLGALLVFKSTVLSVLQL